MSTSDPAQAASAIPGVAGSPVADPRAASAPAGLPDVSMLTQLANEFFRLVPGQAIAPLPAQPGIALPFSAPNPPTGFGTQPPQFGAAAPGAPPLPSLDKVPSETDAQRLAAFPTSFPPEIGSVTLPTSAAAIPAAPALLPQYGGTTQPSISAPPGYEIPAQSGIKEQTSPFSIPLPHFEGGFPAIDLSLLRVPAFVAPANDEKVKAALVPPPQFSAPTAIPGKSASPFSLPLPGFERSFSQFDLAHPEIPALPALHDEDAARAALTTPSPFYFLPDAGTLSQPVSSATVQEPHGVPDLGLTCGQFDVASVRRDFPILNERVNGHPLIWLDNAATTQKPQSVIDRISYFYEHENSNIHRAAHELAARATDAYEDARQKVANFLNASSAKEIVFVRGATEAINLVAQAWGRRHIQQGDEIIVSQIEHHANIVPWQMLCSEKGARLRVIPVDDDGQLLMDEYEKLLNPRTRLVSVTQVSNALGTITPTHAIVQMGHRYGARVLIDGAQAVSHMRVDMQSLDCDFYVFSGHKVFAPTGIGVLYGKPEALAEMPPWQGGGNMIVDVTFEKTIYQPPPSRFEAGTGNIADAVGLGAAIAYLDQIGMENISRHEHDLLIYATREMLTVPGLRIIGTAKEKAGVLSFVLDGYRTEEVGAALNREGIAVRSGHHCAQPTLRRYGLETTVRPSLALYNNYDDIDAMIAALRRLKTSGV